MDCLNDLQAVVAGHICLDIIPVLPNEGHKKLDEIIAPGKSLILSGVNIATGGAVSNTGIALLILGIQTKLMGKVGQDYFGEIITGILKEKGIDNGVSISKTAPTSFSIVISPPGIDRVFLHEPGVNETFAAADIAYDLVKEAKLFHFGYPPAMRKMFLDDGAELLKVFSKVKSLNVTTSLDFALPDPNSESGKINWRNILKRILPLVDIFAPSIEELFFVLRKNEYKQRSESSKGTDLHEAFNLEILGEFGAELLDLGVKIAIIKCGKKGFYIRTQDAGVLSGLGKAVPADLPNWSGRELFEESYRVSRTVSANGTGDTSIAGFLASLLTGKTIEESLKIACAVGAQCVQTLDALSGLKSLEDTFAAVKEGMIKNRLVLNGSYWKFNRPLNVWVGKKDSLIGRD